VSGILVLGIRKTAFVVFLERRDNSAVLALLTKPDMIMPGFAGPSAVREIDRYPRK